MCFDAQIAQDQQKIVHTDFTLPGLTPMPRRFTESTSAVITGLLLRNGKTNATEHVRTSSNIFKSHHYPIICWLPEGGIPWQSIYLLRFLFLIFLGAAEPPKDCTSHLPQGLRQIILQLRGPWSWPKPGRNPPKTPSTNHLINGLLQKPIRVSHGNRRGSFRSTKSLTHDGSIPYVCQKNKV